MFIFDVKFFHIEHCVNFIQFRFTNQKKQEKNNVLNNNGFSKLNQLNEWNNQNTDSLVDTRFQFKNIIFSLEILRYF